MNGQIRFDRDTTIKKTLTLLLNKYKGKYLHTKDKQLYFDLKAKASLILEKIGFIEAVVDDSYYGGEKSGSERKNDLIRPVMSTSFQISLVMEGDPATDIAQTGKNLWEVDSLLNMTYLSNIKNKYKNVTVTGDDDSSNLVEVRVKVLETFAGKKELAGFEVYCETPFVRNSREDFSPTPNAKRLLEAGVRRFHIKRGKVSQDKVGHIIFDDPDTHTVIFSNTASRHSK